MSENLTPEVLADPIQAAKERLTKWLRVCDEESFFDYDELANNDLKALLAELSRLEGESSAYKADLARALTRVQRGETALAEARRQVAERDEALKEVLPWAEMGFFLWDARSFTAGDRQTEPEERTIEWQWQQARPDDYGMTAMRADVEKFLADLTEDTEATPWVLELPVVAARALLVSPPSGAEIKPVTMLVDQDWLSRHVTTDPDASVEAGPDVLAWLSENQNVELSFDYGDADDDGKGWCVHRVNGGVNDREWTLIGTGETPLSALRAALQRKGEAG